MDAYWWAQWRWWGRRKRAICAFIRKERAELEALRTMVRLMQRGQLPEPDPSPLLAVPDFVPAPLSVGQRG